MATPPWIVHIEAFVDPDHPPAQQVANYDAIKKLLAIGKLTLQQIVKDMGEYLATPDNAVRARGTLLVAELLSQLEAEPLEDGVVHSFTSFFSSRLADWHALRGALVGCLALLKRKTGVGSVIEEDAKLLAQSALENLQVQALAQQDRMFCLELIECLLRQHGTAVASLGDRLVDGVCAAIDGEKDPRCLLLGFQIVELLVQLFPDPEGPVGDLAEDVFSIISCYFPISFNPPPNDTRGITRDDLSAALMHAFASASFFSPFCIPLLLEKLSSSLRSAKLESLRYLGFCGVHYGARIMQEFVEEIWVAFKRELLPSSGLGSTSAGSTEEKDREVRQEALACLTKLIKIFQDRSEGIGKKIDGDKLLQLILEDDCLQDFFNCLPCVLIESNDAIIRCKESGHGSVDGNSMRNKRARDNAKAIGHLVSAAAKASCSACLVVLDKMLMRIFETIRVPFKVGDLDVLELSTGKPSNFHFDFTGFVSVDALEVLHLLLEAARVLAEDSVPSRENSCACLQYPYNSDGFWLEPIKASATQFMAAFSLAVMIGLHDNFKRTTLLSEEPFKLGVAGLQSLASFPPSLAPLSMGQFQTIVSLLLNVVLNSSKIKLFWDQATQALSSVCIMEEKFSVSAERSAIVNEVIPCFLRELTKEENSLPVELNLHALAVVCSPSPLALTTVVEGLKEILCSSFMEAAQKNELTGTNKKTLAILQGLSLEILPRCCCRELHDKTLLQLVLSLWTVVEAVATSLICPSSQIMESSMEVLRVAVQKCNEESQRVILSKASDAISFHWSLISKTPESVGSVTIDFEGIQDGWLAALFASVLVAVKPSVIPYKRQILFMFLRIAVGPSPPNIANAAAEAVASMINKWPVPTDGDGKVEEDGNLTLTDAINMVLDAKWMPDSHNNNGIGISSQDQGHGNSDTKVGATEVKLRGVHLLAWVGKGLTMKGHTKISDVAMWLLSLVQCADAVGMRWQDDTATLLKALWPMEGEEQEISMAASEGFGIIVGDSKTSLNKDHHAVVRPLYKQRFFYSMLSPLLLAVKGASASRRSMLYRAFGYLISGVPAIAVVTEASKVLHLILESLSVLCHEHRDSSILLSALLALSAILVDDNIGKVLAVEHVPAIVNRLIALIQYPFSTMVRETVLLCVGAIVALPYPRVFPVRAQVLKGLSVALDDRKRVVRREAVRCHQAWSAIMK